MGRKKAYDRDELLVGAVEVFREHGFARTTTQMLVDRLGVNRFSLYAEFENKLGLYDAALEAYDESIVGRRFGPLERPGAGLAEVRELLEFYGAAADGPAAGKGCLLCNTAVEFGPDDPIGTGRVDRYLDRLEEAFSAALTNAQQAGDLPASVNVAREASFLTASVLGLFVMIRARAPDARLKNAAAAALAHLEGLG
ncbi:MAG: TetR/AcrR family transcriptional regulator [Gemmatimonadota bacterium]